MPRGLFAAKSQFHYHGNTFGGLVIAETRRVHALGKGDYCLKHNIKHLYKLYIILGSHYVALLLFW